MSIKELKELAEQCKADEKYTEEYWLGKLLDAIKEL